MSGPAEGEVRPGRTDEDERALLRQDADRVEVLLDEIRGLVGPLAWGRVEELVERIVRFHGAGLRRVLELSTSAKEVDPSFANDLVEDELVSSLLLLHGLHPLSTAERVERALAEVRPYLSSHAGGVELLEIDESGVAHLRLLGSCQGCPSSRATIDDAIQRAVEEAAPEVTRIDVQQDGLEAKTELVRIGSGRAKTRWVELEGLSDPPDGSLTVLPVEGVPILVLRVNGTLLAYANACGACNARLEGGALEGGWLTCPACGSRFDVTRAGRSSEGGHLSPVPLLVEGSTARVAVRGVER